MIRCQTCGFVFPSLSPDKKGIITVEKHNDSTSPEAVCPGGTWKPNSNGRKGEKNKLRWQPAKKLKAAS